MSKDVKLPPAGYKRVEELAKRTDELEEQAEVMAEKTGREAMNPNALKPIREIQHAISQGALQVSKAQQGYRYSWVGTHLHGQAIWQKKALGWETVHGEMVEASEYRTEDGSRRIGDTILMRIPEERGQEIDDYNAYNASRRLLSVESELIELGRKYESRGIFVRADGERHEDVMGVAGRRSAMGQPAAKEAFKAEMARSTAASHVDEMLREGTVPGL